MGNRDFKAWIVLIYFLIAFLAGSGVTGGARDVGMTGEVYNPQNFPGGILGPGPWGGGWPFRGLGGWGGLCCGDGGIPGWGGGGGMTGWGWGLRKPELADQKMRLEEVLGMENFLHIMGEPLGKPHEGMLFI